MIKNVWILTFDREKALNRQIKYFGEEGVEVNVFSNHPEVNIWDDNKKYVKQVIVNNLSHEEANSYCARSWNNIFIKCFLDREIEGAIFCQDDTYFKKPGYVNLINQNYDKYDAIWGPLGDTTFFLKRQVIKKIGWFDERYLGCYCCDADYLNRIYKYYDRTRISVKEIHDWGFTHNPIGVEEYVEISMESRAADETYSNQHTSLLKDFGQSVMLYSQGHFKKKWNTPGNGINGIGPIVSHYNKQEITDINWYPWFTKKYL